MDVPYEATQKTTTTTERPGHKRLIVEIKQRIGINSRIQLGMNHVISSFAAGLISAQVNFLRR